MATGRNRQESRNRARARNRFRARGSGKKHWLSRPGSWIAIGATWGVMAGAVFFVSGLAAFQAGLTDVGIGYMVLTAVFPPGTAIAGWWMGRGTDPREGRTD